MRGAQQPRGRLAHDATWTAQVVGSYKREGLSPPDEIGGSQGVKITKLVDDYIVYCKKQQIK